MNHYEEGIDAMWEEVEGKKPESIHQPSDKERWKEFVEKYSHSGYLVQSEFGTIDTTDDAMKDVAGGENLSYEEYLQVLFNSRNIIRHCFEYCYYSNAWCDFKGGLADLIKRKARSYSIASMYLADLWMVIATKVRKTMSGWILGLLKNINQSIDIPIWKRYLLSVTEAAQFYHIGEKRLRQIVDIHPNGEFYLLVGNKVLFKKEKFEQFLAESTAI